jgi:hypothetical protein
VSGLAGPSASEWPLASPQEPHEAVGLTYSHVTYNEPVALLNTDFPLEWLLGTGSGGGTCPVCAGTISNWVLSERGVVIGHARRNYPCLLPGPRR